MHTREIRIKSPLYKAWRWFELPANWKIFPPAYVLSITARCNAECVGCELWRQAPARELTTSEWLRIINSLGDSPYWLTISGGEPFLREDIDLILAECLRLCKPRVLWLPTNATLPEKMVKKLGAALKQRPSSEITVNLPIDGINEEHDRLRGIKGNFAAVLKCLALLRHMQGKNPMLKVGVCTQISEGNVGSLKRIYHYVRDQLKVEDHIFEPEPHCLGASYSAPSDSAQLRDFLKFLYKQSLRMMREKKGGARFREALRANYYKSLLANRPPRRCSAGLLYAHILPSGMVVDCAHSLNPVGSLRDYGWDFKRLWESKEARAKRQGFRRRRCSCRLASVFYINSL